MKHNLISSIKAHKLKISTHFNGKQSIRVFILAEIITKPVSLKMKMQSLVY